MWCDIFHLFVGRNKKENLGNCRLNINVEGHITDLFCLFRYFKSCDLFYLLLFHYIYIFFFLLVVGRKKSLSFHERDIDFADSIVFLAL